MSLASDGTCTYTSPTTPCNTHGTYTYTSPTTPCDTHIYIVEKKISFYIEFLIGEQNRTFAAGE